MQGNNIPCPERLLQKLNQVHYKVYALWGYGKSKSHYFYNIISFLMHVDQVQNLNTFTQIHCSLATAPAFCLEICLSLILGL
jgi:hypothetical protein